MRDINQLHPALRLLCKHLKAVFPEIGFAETYRTVGEQNNLYAQGRTAPGQIVTYARGETFSSQHQWKIAVDFYKNVSGHAYDDESFFRKVGEEAERCGFSWGGRWTHPVDMPHIYIGKWGDTPDELKKIYGTPDEFFKSKEFTQMLDEDGYLGINTICALERYFDVEADGVLDKPSETIRRLQRMLNQVRKGV